MGHQWLKCIRNRFCPSHVGTSVRTIHSSILCLRENPLDHFFCFLIEIAFEKSICLALALHDASLCSALKWFTAENDSVKRCSVNKTVACSALIPWLWCIVVVHCLRGGKCKAERAPQRSTMLLCDSADKGDVSCERRMQNPLHQDLFSLFTIFI